MRLLLLILMIALLPLRSWALVAQPLPHHPATFLAIEKEATQAQPAAPKGLNSANIAPEHPCHSALQNTNEAVVEGLVESGPTLQSAPETNCSTCGDCATCHTLAAMSAPQIATPPLLSHWLRPSSSAHFDSALAALGLKPPIA
jgi:cytochrome c553